MNSPVLPPLIRDLHHQRWSSIASWKYVIAMVIKLLTSVSNVNEMNKMPNRVYTLWPHIDAKM